jgi:hypothetical protein
VTDKPNRRKPMARNLGRTKVKCYGSNHDGMEGMVVSVFNVRVQGEIGPPYDKPYAVILLDGYNPLESPESFIIEDLEDCYPAPKGS